MPVLGQHVGGAAEHRRSVAAVGCAAMVMVVVCTGLGPMIVVMVVIVRIGRGRIAGGQIAGGRRLRRALAFLAQELAVAQAQDALVDADRIAALDEGIGGYAPAFADQRLGVDDDLPLAAEVRGQGLLDAAFHFGAKHRLGAGQAQDHAAAAADLCCRCVVVAHFQLGDHIVAGLCAQGGQIKGVGKAPCCRLAAAVEGHAAPDEGDVLAAALGGGDRQRRLREDAMIVAGLEA
ncbi:hypothetical protein D3C72_1277980 [compost metagenome]